MLSADILSPVRFKDDKIAVPPVLPFKRLTPLN